MRYITWREFAARLSVSISTAKRLYAEDPDFPRKVRLSPKRVGFPEHAVNKYMARLAEREAA